MGAPRTAGRRRRRIGVPLLVLAVGLAVAAPASAAAPLKLREVFPGSSANGAGAEYVMLQMTADGQAGIAGQTLQFFDAEGGLDSTYAIPVSVANGQSQRTVLLATQEAVEDLPGLPGPDFNLGTGGDRMDPVGGGVCFTGATPADCVTWGSIPLADLQNPYLPDRQSANAAAIADGLALRRRISAGCPTYLDAADDSASSASDFAQTSPAPRNNAALPTETRCPPDTSLLTFPPNPSNQTSAAFTYAALPDEPGVSFECKLDSGAFAPCPTTGKSYPGPLSEGLHSFQVRAVGEGGADPSPKSLLWIVDADPPETTIDSFPPEPSGGFEARFDYSSSEPFSSFRCQLDSGPIQVCPAAGKSYFQLTDGVHTFRVWATDNAGNEDPTPAERVFTVQGVLIDVTAPDTSIVSAPSDPSSSDSAAFTYASNEQGSTFECSLNSSPFAPCGAAGVSYSRLRNGSYIFSVRAVDAAGNADSVPAAYAWTVAARLPTVTFVKSPPGRVSLRKGSKVRLRFGLEADKPGSTFRCRLDKRPFKPCAARVTVKAPVGRHRFEAYAIDALGNTGTAISRRIVRVQRAGEKLL